MADGPLGYSFAPTFENAEMGRQGGSPAEFPQGSIKVLNFQIPRIAGAPGPNAISPLVGDTPSGAAGFGSAVLQSVLHTVLGPDAAAAISGANPSGRDPGAALLDEWLRRERALNGRGGGVDRDDAPAPGPSSPSTPSPSAPSEPSSPFPDSPPPPPRPDPPFVVHPGGDPDPGGGVSGPSFDNPPEPRPVPSWREDKYYGGWGQDYQS